MEDCFRELRMSTQPNSPVPVEKQRIRSMIDDQVQEFLRRGGKISVVNQNESGGSPLGGVWQTLHDELGLSARAD